MGGDKIFRFRPRLPLLPWAVAGVGLSLAVAALVFDLGGVNRTFAFACGLVGPVLAALYLAAPAWRFRVIVGDDGLAVKHGETERFRLAWSEVRRLIVARSSSTAFVDGGGPAKNLLVPGPGAPGPYRIERRQELVALLVEKVPADRRREVDSLETFKD